jgi:hypothetical protein
MAPERYGLTPNAVDPVFYTAYTSNFDDIMAAVGDRWYFVSRWSAYLPARLFVAVAGPADGRLLWRWLLATAIVLSLWRLGRRWSWTGPQRLLVATIVLTMPMFSRAFMTDYVEYIVVSLGICLVCLALSDNHNVATKLVVGCLAGLIVIANPVAITSVILPCVACVVLTTRTKRAALTTATIIAVGIAIPVVFGWFWFRWRYGMDNVYQPTIDFIREDRPIGASQKTLYWLGSFTWVFATPVLLVSAVLLARRTEHRFDRVERIALSLCALQYSYQWVDQFIRHGGGLELPYYWSFSIPSFAVALAVVVGHFFKTERATFTLAVLAASILLLLLGVPTVARLPDGAWYAVCCLLLIAAVAWTARRSTSLVVVLLLGWITWTQIGAPVYRPLNYHQFVADPHYDAMYGRSTTESEQIFDQILWFEKRMDEIPDDWKADFVAFNGIASTVLGLYGPQVTGRLVQLNNDYGLRERLPAEIGAGFHPLTAVYGPQALVGEFVRTVVTQGSGASIELDATQPGKPGYRLAVLRATGTLSLPITWPADSLPRALGLPGAQQSVDVPPHSSPGFVTYGPYVDLPPGRYEAELTYSSDSPSSNIVGGFDVVYGSLPTEVTIATMNGTGGLESKLVVPFEVAGTEDDWQFRTTWAGTSQFTVNAIRLTAVSP